MSDPGPVVVGLGLHRPMRAQELERIAHHQPIQHDPDDVVPTAVVDGIQGTVARRVAEAPFSIAVGVVELHQYAGVSGGHKAVSVGCGGRVTIGELHSRSRVLQSGVGIGTIDGNPFRAAVEALGRAAGCRLALVWVPATQEWLFGSPEAVVREGLRRIQPWSFVGARAAGVVLKVPQAKACSLYQASRAATYLSESPSPAIEEGGTIVIDAACPEGLGSEAGFVRALRGCAPPWRELLSGPAPKGAGAQRAVMLARLAERFHLEVQGCENPEPLVEIGISARRGVVSRPSTWLVVDDPFQRLPQCVDPLRSDT